MCNKKTIEIMTAIYKVSPNWCLSPLGEVHATNDSRFLNTNKF